MRKPINRKQYQRQYQREYYHRNIDNMRQKRRNYYNHIYKTPGNDNRKRKRKLYMKNYRAKHPDKMKKYNRNISHYEHLLRTNTSYKWRQTHHQQYLKSMYKASAKIYINRYASKTELRHLIHVAQHVLSTKHEE